MLVRTHLGYGSPHKQDTFEAHGSPVGEEEVKLTKQNLGWPLDPAFYIPREALAHFREAVERGSRAESEWNEKLTRYTKSFPELATEFGNIMAGGLPEGWDAEMPSFAADAKGVATRAAGGKILNAVAPRLPNLIGGSADLNPSTYTVLKGLGDFESPATTGGDQQGAAGGGWSYGGRNLHFGVREHAMGSILNGLSVHGGIIPYGATFLIFSDYMRPSIRLAALMKQRVIYVFTHDSIGLGEDGPTHQPVEQLASLRSVPNLIVLRPADANETAEAWRVALNRAGGPAALVLTRQNVPVIDRTGRAPAAMLRRGGYVLADPAGGEPQVLIIATGSEVQLALAAGGLLAAGNIRARVVSLPSWELFEAQPREYRESVLPPSITARVGIETGVRTGWERYIGPWGEFVGMSSFGASAPGQVAYEKFGFSAENVAERARIALSKVNGEVPVAIVS